MKPPRKIVLALLGAAALCLAFGAFPVASNAAASLERVTAQRGQWMAPNQQGCVPSSVTVPLRTTPGTLSFQLPAGQDYEGEDGSPAWTVSGVQAEASGATWNLEPGPSCADTDPKTQWRFAYGWSVKKYVIRTKSGVGVRSVGGFRMDSKATVKAARRKFGRPSRVRSSSGQVCTVTWRRIGLRMVFVNYGGVRACDHGWAQAALVFRPGLWAVQVDNRPAVTTDSSLSDLVSSELAERVKGGWQLDSFYNMIGDEGYYPSVVALASNSRSTIRAFDVWLGRGGD